MSILSKIFGSRATSPCMKRLDDAFEEHSAVQTATRSSISQLQKAVVVNQAAKAEETKAIHRFTGHQCGLCKHFSKDCGVGFCNHPEMDKPMSEEDTCEHWEAAAE